MISLLKLNKTKNTKQTKTTKTPTTIILFGTRAEQTEGKTHCINIACNM